MIEKMNHHYSMTNPATVYDEEALTALELVGRTTAKVNETVEAFNTLEKNTGDHLNKQDDTIEERMKTQDDRITKMNDETMPEKVTTEVQKRIDDGSFDTSINQYIGNLEERVDNLLGSTTEGSTTMDAEVIDIRTGRDGKTYANAGEAVRAKANLKDINKLLNNDLLSNQYKSFYTGTDIVYEHSGVETYAGCPSEKFTLPSGDYEMIIPDTNCARLILSGGNVDTRIYDCHRDAGTGIKGTHYFTVPEEFDGMEFQFDVWVNQAETAPAGTYYVLAPYIYKRGETPKIPNYLLEAQYPLRLLDSDVVRHENLFPHNGVELSAEYDGVTTYKSFVTPQFSLEAGTYNLIVADSNCITAFVLNNNSDRLYRHDGDIVGVHKFTITEASDFISLSFNISLATPNVAGHYFVRGIYIFKDSDVPLFPEYLTHYEELTEKIEAKQDASQVPKIGGGYLSVSGNMVENGAITIPDAPHVKKNVCITFRGDFTTFSGVRIGQGKNAYGGGFIEITPTQIIAYMTTSSISQYASVEHGLNISGFISVCIKNGSITVLTSPGSYTANISWSACNGDVFAESMGGAFSDCVLNWTTADLDSKVWVFGDSYLGMDASRWAGQMVSMGFENWLACGYPGGNSVAELNSLSKLLDLYTPDVVVWCLGMNNGDNGVVNSSWLECVERVIEMCETRNIEIVLSTIPTCPVVDNTYKNEWVKASGKRYVDFNKAVGVNGTEWFEGMLSEDNVHPSVLGAKALCHRVLIDVPEIAQ